MRGVFVMVNAQGCVTGWEMFSEQDEAAVRADVERRLHDRTLIRYGSTDEAGAAHAHHFMCWRGVHYDFPQPAAREREQVPYGGSDG